MKLIRFRNNQPISTPEKRRGSEEVRFFAITLVSLFGPVLLLSIVMGQVWPLFMVAGSDLLGATLGVRSFNQTSRDTVRQLHLLETPDEVNNEETVELKKAA